MRTNLLKDIFEFFSDGSLTECEKNSCLCPAILVPFFAVRLYGTYIQVLPRCISSSMSVSIKVPKNVTIYFFVTDYVSCHLWRRLMADTQITIFGEKEQKNGWSLGVQNWL